MPLAPVIALPGPSLGSERGRTERADAKACGEQRKSQFGNSHNALICWPFSERLHSIACAGSNQDGPASHWPV
jgi:hypothetical protein